MKLYYPNAFQANVKCSGPLSKSNNEHHGIGLQRPALCRSALLYSVSPYLAVYL